MAPPLLPLCLELGSLEESSGVREQKVERGRVDGTDEDDDEEGSGGPPTKLALLQVSESGQTHALLLRKVFPMTFTFLKH